MLIITIKNRYSNRNPKIYLFLDSHNNKKSLIDKWHKIIEILTKNRNQNFLRVYYSKKIIQKKQRKMKEKEVENGRNEKEETRKRKLQ